MNRFQTCSVIAAGRLVMMIRKLVIPGLSVLCMLLGSVSIYAQTPNPPHIEVTKEMLTLGEICPGGVIDISITLTGAGSTAYLRYPVNAVCVIDKSGSMGFGGNVGYNVNLEPPYAAVGTPGYTGTWQNPYVATIWAAWKFYQYFVDHPPQTGYDDYGGLVFYDYNTVPSGVPGAFAQSTPTPIQRVRDNPLDPAHKQFWWFDRLSRQAYQGNTAMGPGMQYTRGLLAAMPMHVPWYGPGTPTPATPKPPIQGNKFMVLMSDGRPNLHWTPGPGEVPSWPGNNYAHAIEMARRISLQSPYGAYTQTWNTTIFTLGLGSEVDTLLMTMLADPWNPAYWGGTPRPSNANYGFFSWALTEEDLIDTFEAIAGNIVSNLAGSNIYVLEMIPAVSGSCPGGANVFTEIVPDSWNYTPTVIPPATPGGNPQYTWNFNELLIGDELVITFQMAIPTYAPLNTPSLIECPESAISYTNYDGFEESYGINDPGFNIGLCDGPTVTPTFTQTPSPSPTCIQQTLFFDDFETGDFSLWDNAIPTWGAQVYSNNSYAHNGDHFAFLAGCEEEVGFGPHNSYLFRILSLDEPVRPGAVLEFYVRLKNFIFPQKFGGGSGFDDPQEYDLFMIEITDLNGHFWFDEFTFFDMKDDYFQVRAPMQAFAGSDQVRIRLLANFPITTHDPDPWDSVEPMVFLDDVMVYDFCYEPTPTPTPTPPPYPYIPATSSKGIAVTLLIIGIMIAIPIIRRAA